MNSLENWMILTPLQKLPNNLGDLGKTIVATGFEWLPKVNKIAQSGHTGGTKPNVTEYSMLGILPLDLMHTQHLFNAIATWKTFVQGPEPVIPQQYGWPINHFQF